MWRTVKMAALIILGQEWRLKSNNVIEKGLAFSFSQSGTVLAKRAFKTLPDPALSA